MVFSKHALQKSVIIVCSVLLFYVGQNRLVAAESADPWQQKDVPAEAEALVREAISLVERGEYSEAVGKLAASTRLTPNYIRAHYDLGVTYGLWGTTPGNPSSDALAVSLFYLRQALAYAEQEHLIDAWLYYGIGWNKLMQLIFFAPKDHGEREALLLETEDAYKQALSLDPHHTGSLVNLGVLAQLQGRHGQALEYFTQAAELGDAKGVENKRFLLELFPSLEKSKNVGE